MKPLPLWPSSLEEMGWNLWMMTQTSQHTNNCKWWFGSVHNMNWSWTTIDPLRSTYVSGYGMLTTPLRTYFTCFYSVRATKSDHNNPVFKNLADEVYSRQKLSGELYNGFEEKEILTNELLSSLQILHPPPNSAQDSGDNYVCRGPNTTMLKLFRRTSTTNGRHAHTNFLCVQNYDKKICLD